MFDVDRFVEDCRAALGDATPLRALRDRVAEAAADGAAITAALGEPTEAGLTPLYQSPDLTVVQVVWGPRMSVLPHDHTMWAVNAVYSGREDNLLWRRLPADGPCRIEAAGARSVGPGEVLSLGPEAVHSVLNPMDRLTAAIHVYGGDFFGRTGSSEWPPETLTARAFDMNRTRAEFARANRLLRAMAAA